MRTRCSPPHPQEPRNRRHKNYPREMRESVPGLSGTSCPRRSSPGTAFKKEAKVQLKYSRFSSWVFPFPRALGRAPAGRAPHAGSSSPGGGVTRRWPAARWHSALSLPSLRILSAYCCFPLPGNKEEAHETEPRASPSHPVEETNAERTRRH